MRTIKINLYKFDELTEESKSNAISLLRDINVDENWWSHTYDYFKDICKSLSFDVASINFNGFNSQGDGSTFRARLNPLLLILACECDAYKLEFPSLDLSLPNLKIDRRVRDSIDNGTIALKCSVTGSRSHDLIVNMSHNCEGDNISKALEKVHVYIEKVLNILNNHLYSTLNSEFEYLSSDEAIIETIESNDYEFNYKGELN